MIKVCTNPSCPHFQTDTMIQKDGRYFRASDSRWIQRFRCRYCKRRFSAACFSDEYRLKHRRITPEIKRYLVSGVSQRRVSLLLKVSRVTVARRFAILRERARRSQLEYLDHLRKAPVKKVQFDDLVTIEHTKMKPLTVSIAVDSESRAILGAKVGRIPASGHLAKKSRAKYGKRPSEHMKTLKALFQEIHQSIDQKANFRSDQHHYYPVVLEKFFQNPSHKTFKGRKSCIAGQGELKKVGRDPLFYINHTCAMLRANINRLIRRTWCSTKCPEKLQWHLDIFIDYYNREYLKILVPTK